jgi:hypothetical protein
VNSTCPHGCAGWCATCDYDAAHPEGDPRVIGELPGRRNVTCPRRDCGHPLSEHKDGICLHPRCWCGMPDPRDDDGWMDRRRSSLADLIRGIANEVEGESPVVARMLDKALELTRGRSW